MNDSAEAPSTGSDNGTTKQKISPPPPPPQVGKLIGKGNSSSEDVAADAPSNENNGAGKKDPSPAAPPPKQDPPPPPAAPPPKNKSPPPPSPPPSKPEASPPPPQQLSPPPPAEKKSPPPPPPSPSPSPLTSAAPPPPTENNKRFPLSPPPPTENDQHSPLTPPPPPPSPSPSASPPSPTTSARPPPPPPKQETSPPPPPPPSTSPSQPPPPSTSPSQPPPPNQPPSKFPPPSSSVNSTPPPPPSPPGPMSALAPRMSPVPVGALLPNGSNNAVPRTGGENFVPTPGTIKGNVVSPAGNGNGGTLPVAIGVAGVFIVAFVAIFFLFARRMRKKESGGIPGNYIPPKNFSVKTDAFLCGQPQSGLFPGQNDPLSSYSYAYSQKANSNGSQRGWHHGSGGVPDSGVIGGVTSFFNYDEILDMTHGFSPETVIGEGGFGSVYKGQLPDGKLVAVKNLKIGSGQGDREFKAEVEIISRVHHRHLVSLVGYCIAEDHRVLIYEFVSNNTLDHHLHGKGLPVLEWSKRLKIALGAAKGLAYLHEDCHPKIIHRDIKSANILLEDDFEAQVADFGLARPNSDAHTHVSTRVMGTFGYLAPEYASSGKLTDKSDVYSFGVVLLELITGRKPVDTTRPLGDESLVEWARPVLLHALETRDFSEVVDPRLEKHYVEVEMFRMIEAAAACIRHSAPKRPRMMQVVRALDCEGEMSDLSNGVKYGQSTIYDSGQYDQDIQKFHRMAFGSRDGSDIDYTGVYNSNDYSVGHQTKSPSWGSHTSSPRSSGSETRALTSSNNRRVFNL